MREVVVTETIRCDVCREKSTEMHPVDTKAFSWGYREYEIDLCPTDLKEIDTMFEALIDKGRRSDRKSTVRASRPRTAPYTNDTRVRQFFNEETGLYVCPGVTMVEGVEHACGRQFDTPNGLAIHHKRKHGEHLLS